MSWNSNKKALQSKIHQHASEVDVEDIWNNIESEVDAINTEKKSKKKAAWWLVLLIGIGISSGFWMWSNQDKSSFVIDWNDNQVETDLENLKVAQRSDVSEANLQAVELSENVELKKPNQVLNQHKKAQNLEKDEIHNDEKETKLLIKNKIKAERKDVPIFSYNQKINTSEKAFISRNNPTIKGQVNSNSIEKEALNNQLSVKKNGQSRFLLSNEMVEIKSLHQGIFDNKTVQLNDDFNSIAFQVPNHLKSQMNFEINKKGFNYFLGVNVGYSFAKQNLVAKSDSDPIYFEFRNASEKLVGANQIEVRFSARHTSGFELITGIRRTRIIQKFDYTYTYSLTRQTNAFVTQEVEQLPTPQIETIQTFVNKKYYSKYNYLEIPLMLGYHINAKKFNFGIETGIYASYLLITKGKISDVTGLEDIDIHSNSDDRYTSKLGIGYAFGITLGYDLNKKLALNFSPTLQYNPTDYAAKNHQVKLKQTLIGGNVGLSFKLNR